MFLLKLLIKLILSIGLLSYANAFAQDNIQLSPKNIIAKKSSTPTDINAKNSANNNTKNPENIIPKKNNSEIKSDKNIVTPNSQESPKANALEDSKANIDKTNSLSKNPPEPKTINKTKDNSSKTSPIITEKNSKNLVKSPVKNSEQIPSKQVISNSFADLVEDLLPSVVNITTSQELKNNNNLEDNFIEEFPKTPLFDDLRKHLERQLRQPNEMKRKLSSIGSGFIISKDGLIVTNHHVIDDANDITISLHDGSKYKAKVIGIDKKTDVALLKINPSKELKFVNFGDSSLARIGEWVIVIGNPYGLGGSVSLGIVSARGRDINNGQNDEFIQTDAAINKGNSGGPMFNARGEVIGISTAIFSPSGGSVGIGFATPSNSVLQVVKQLRDQGEVTRGWIGVSVQDISEDIADSMKLENNKGAFVVEVIKDGPADKAGLLPTDIILKFEDQDIEDMKFLPKAVAKFPVGKIAKLQILRQGKIKNLKIVIEKLKDNEIRKVENKTIEKKPTLKATAQILGLSLAEYKSKIRKDKNEISVEGLLVTDVNPKSESAEKGIAIGDIILSANQIPIKSIDDLRGIIEENSKSNKKIFLFIRRNENSYPAVLNLK
jgi:serine protease Do